MTVNHYLNNLPLLTNQITPNNYRDGERQRIYLKDIDCPDQWRDRLRAVLPPFVFYLNDCSSADPHDHRFAPAGDLMSCLPEYYRAQNLQGYIGHEGTYTPCHRDMCASLGQNIMVEASEDGREDGEATVAGSSLWFMVESNDRAAASEYFKARLGHDIETEHHYAQLNAWTKAPFRVHIIEQRAGDFILVPPLAPHQVWNRGTRTMKIAWNRTTVDTLGLAFGEALHNARMVCRDEQYQCKAIVHYSLQKYSRLLREARDTRVMTPKLKQLKKEFKRLFVLYTNILLSESFSQKMPTPKTVEYLPFQSNVACEYCRCNIFNRFLTCKRCTVKLITGDEETYDVCMECYSLGRSCSCVSRLTWCEQFNWKELQALHCKYRQQIIEFEAAIGNDVSRRYRALDTEQSERAQKTLAEVCQEELKRRPFHDPEKQQQRSAVDELTMYETDDAGGDEDERVARKRRKLKGGHIAKKNHLYCHFCRTLEPSWKVASCSECNTHYCYGILYRAFDTVPPTTMHDPRWKCPKCRKTCSCSACLRDPEVKPYRPLHTILGHDTLKIAHYKSVQALVDFSRSNISWMLKMRNNTPRHNSSTEALLTQAPAVASAAAAERGTSSPAENDTVRLQQFSINNNNNNKDYNNNNHNDGNDDHDYANDDNENDTANLIRLAEQAVGHSSSLVTGHEHRLLSSSSNGNNKSNSRSDSADLLLSLPVDPALAVRGEGGGGGDCGWKMREDNIFNDRFRASEAVYVGYRDDRADHAGQYAPHTSQEELRTIDPKVIQNPAATATATTTPAPTAASTSGEKQHSDFKIVSMPPSSPPPPHRTQDVLTSTTTTTATTATTSSSADWLHDQNFIKTALT